MNGNITGIPRVPGGFSEIRDLPEVDTPGMIEVDRLMMEDYRISLFQMMENAGRCLAILARAAFLKGSARGKRVAVLAGSGGNGGGALVAGRRLATWGASVQVVPAQQPEAMADVPRRQLEILHGLCGATSAGDDGLYQPFDVILDGLIGYSLSGAPAGRAAELIGWANGNAAPVIALDVPSDFDATGGRVFEPAIRAAATPTIALPKTGLRDPAHRDHVGALYCADISVPPDLYRRLSPPLTAPPFFAEGDIVRVA